MAPLVVEGDTLGQKHRNYNKIVNETTQELIPNIDYDEPDLDNLFKIDIACKNRNVDYIIKVLQCEDMLYVSRAIKRSTWLITDPQYANIVNPNYLNDQLAPNMMTKAFNKLLLHVRLNLKDEKRVGEFFKYYEEKNLEVAFKWLQSCSISLTKETIQKHGDDIPHYIYKRIFKKSITLLRTTPNETFFQRSAAVAVGRFYIKSNMNKYLDIVETYDCIRTTPFGPRATKLLMKKCGERVMKNLEKYYLRIHIPTFAKYMKREDVKDFVKTNIANYKITKLFEYGNINFFVNRIPIENRFEFIEGVIADNKNLNLIVRFCCNDSLNLYYLYGYAPFDTAFVALKKRICLETNRDKRTSMFEVMLTSTRNDIKNIHTVLKYYRETHINEPADCTTQFVNLVISCANTHNFSKETWGYLNDLFISMDVYCESDKPVQNCVKSIILYSILHDESIPDIIEKKFLFETFNVYQKELSKEEKDKVFLYLYKYLTSKIDTRKINDKKSFGETVEELKNMLHLFLDWNKELQEFTIVLDKISEIVHLSQKNNWGVDISVLYNVKKSWKKVLFAKSIILCPTQEVCINVLKHGPKLLETYQNEVETLCLNDNKPMNQFLKKVRIYWSKTLANTYKDYFMLNKGQRNKHKAAIIGLCTLLQKNELSNLLQKYAPIKSVIDWSQSDDVELNLRKHIASNMLLARPQPSPAVVLLYAKGDYLQFALPSLNAIVCNISYVQILEHLTQLLDSTGFVQKQGIKIAFSKLKHDELKIILFDNWKTNKNSSIRAAIFNQTLDFLRTEKEPSSIRKLWELLSAFVDNLTSEDGMSIYTKLSQTEKVPMSVRPEFWMKSYKFLKSLPPKANCTGLLNHLKNKMSEVVKFLDNDLAAEIFLESFDENFSTKKYEFQFLVVEFLLSAKTEEAHIARYNKIFIPILERSFIMWNTSHKDTHYVRENLKDILSFLDNQFHEIVFRKKMIIPVPMYTDMLKRLRENLPLEENYVIITTRKLSRDCVKLFDKILKTKEALASDLLESSEFCYNYKFEPLHAEIAAELGKLCVKYLREDVSDYFPSIYKLFVKAFKHTFEKFEFSEVNKTIALKAFLECKDFIPGYLFVIESLEDYVYKNEMALNLINDIITHPSKEIKMHSYLKKLTVQNFH